MSPNDRFGPRVTHSNALYGGLEAAEIRRLRRVRGGAADHELPARAHLSCLGAKVGGHGAGLNRAGIVEAQVHGKATEQVVETDAVVDGAARRLEKEMDVPDI